MAVDIRHIKQKLKTHIKTAGGINQKTVAALVGISDSALSQLLNDERKGSLELISAIAEASGTSLKHLIESAEGEDEGATEVGGDRNVIALHQSLIPKFQDPDWGYKMNQLLLQIEKDPGLKQHVETIMEALAEQTIRKGKKSRQKKAV